METQESNPVIFPDDLKRELSGILYPAIIFTLKEGACVVMADMLEVCVYRTWDWLSEHALDYYEIFYDVTLEELVDSIKTACSLPDDAVCQTSPTTFQVTLANTSWTFFREINDAWVEKTDLRIAYNRNEFRSLIPKNKTSAIIRYLDSLVPEFRKMISQLTLDCEKNMLISAIKKTANEVGRK